LAIHEALVHVTVEIAVACAATPLRRGEAGK
jgi:hypothetical protein